MNDSERPTEGGRRRGKVAAAMPYITVTDQASLAKLLDEWRWLLHDQAVKQLGETSEAEAALERVIARLKAIEHPWRSRALQWVMQRLREECYRTRARLEARPASEGEPVDPVLGVLDGPKWEAVQALPYGQREALLLVARDGLAVDEVAQRLNRPVAAIKMRLYRARVRVRQQIGEDPSGILPALLLLTGSWRRAADSWHRHIGTRLASLAQVVEPGSLTISAVALAAVAVTISSAAYGPAVPTTPATGEGSPSWLPVTAASVVLGQSGPTHQDSDHGPAVELASRGAAPDSVVATSALLAGRTADTETPEDTQLVAASAADSFGQHPVIVALGVGRTCQCYVLYRSTDGGATWTGSAAPPGVDQVVLPSDYPSDPVIFLGSPAEGTAPDYMVDGAGVPVALPGPPGHLALSANYGSGDPRVFVGSRSSVWSLNLATSRVAVELTYAGSPWAAQLAPATGQAGGAVMAVVPPAPTDEVAGRPVFAAPGLYMCPNNGDACQLQGAAPGASPQALVSAPVGDAEGALATLVPNGVAISRDGGRTFASLATPAGAGQATSLAVSSGRVWAVFAQPRQGSFRLEWAPVGGGPWHDATTDNPALSRGSQVVSAPGGLVLDLLLTGGLRCSADGQSWLARCPAASH